MAEMDRRLLAAFAIILIAQTLPASAGGDKSKNVDFEQITGAIQRQIRGFASMLAPLTPAPKRKRKISRKHHAHHTVAEVAPVDDHRHRRKTLTEEEGDDGTEDRFRSGFIPEESPATDTTKIDSVSEKTFSDDELVSSQRGAMRFGDDSGEATDDDTITVFKGDKSDYCSRYEEHFSFYCVGDVDKNSEVQQQFCPSYKRNCPTQSAGSSGSLSTWPKNPFSKEITVNRPPGAITADDQTPSLTKFERLSLYMKRRVPCTEECDIRIYPHCTEECKCDYGYPAVQKFCNPPPIPLLLNTCRMWYNRCPKYEQYHYASQYMYSKAEKGKVLPGVVAKPVNPYNIPQPGVPVRRRARARAAVAKKYRRLVDNGNFRRDAPLSSEPQRRRSALAEAMQHAEQPIQTTNSAAAMTELQKFRRILHDTYRKKLVQEIAAEETVSSEPTQERARNPISNYGSYSDRLLNKYKRGENYGPGSAALIVPPEISESFRRHRRAKARQGSIPVIPTDASHSMDTFKAFDSFTDTHGIAHRPRTRSPWSKPALWEPNPDNPHNRDHANKFWYHPDSVTADWLNGQIEWNGHWGVPAAGAGGSDGYSVAHFPSIGNFLNIPDDYD